VIIAIFDAERGGNRRCAQGTAAKEKYGDNPPNAEMPIGAASVLTAGLLCCDFDVLDLARWWRDEQAIFSQAVDMKLYGLPNLSLYILHRRASSDASW